jgi:OOP family OmpA-OmpF porin
MTHRSAKAWLPLCLSLAVLAALPAHAQQAPLKDASVNDFIKLLGADDMDGSSKAFKPTARPDANHRCAGQTGTARTAGSGNTKNLEVVGYADDTAPQAQLAIQFEYSSDRLLPNDKRLLDKLATALKSPQLQSARFAVAGHTDRSGSRDINLQLSCARALASKAYLEARGVAQDRLTAYGFGPDHLLSGFGADSPEHRRVEIRRADD